VYRTHDIAVTGGTLHVGAWGDGPTVIIAAHGLTANHLSFAPLARHLGSQVTLIAPDLRGRGGSGTVGPPYGMAAHADDLVAVLDHLEIPRAAAIVGHSMGGFVAVVAADRHPDRLGQVFLVDGGLPLPTTLADLPVEDAIRAVVGPALDRLQRTFPSLAAYLNFWRAHPALADAWNDDVEATFAYDLVGAAAHRRSSVVEAAVIEDSRSQMRSGVVEAALARRTTPAILLRAPRGLFNQEPPLYPDELVDAGRALHPQLVDRVVPHVNHYTIVLSDQGAADVAAIIFGKMPPVSVAG
jgi:lipase